jgi:hypothetical protein
VAERIDEQGHLGEQFGGDIRDPRHYDEWVDRWGPPAVDLTWSHAMYVILANAIERGAGAAKSDVGTSSTGASTGSPEVAQ